MTGGDYETLNEGKTCWPYEIPNCAHHAKAPFPDCESGILPRKTPKCRKECEEQQYTAHVRPFKEVSSAVHSPFFFFFFCSYHRHHLCSFSSCPPILSACIRHREREIEEEEWRKRGLDRCIGGSCLPCERLPRSCLPREGGFSPAENGSYTELARTSSCTDGSKKFAQVEREKRKTSRRKWEKKKKKREGGGFLVFLLFPPPFFALLRECGGVIQEAACVFCFFLAGLAQGSFFVLSPVSRRHQERHEQSRKCHWGVHGVRRFSELQIWCLLARHGNAHWRPRYQNHRVSAPQPAGGAASPVVLHHRHHHPFSLSGRLGVGGRTERRRGILPSLEWVACSRAVFPLGLHTRPPFSCSCRLHPNTMIFSFSFPLCFVFLFFFKE